MSNQAQTSGEGTVRWGEGAFGNYS